MRDDDRDDGPECSPEQTAYIKIATAIRADLAKRAKKLEEMDVENLHCFTDLCSRAVCFEAEAHSFDKQIEVLNNRSSF